VVDEFIHTTHAGEELDCLTCHMQIGDDDIGPEGKIRTAHSFEVMADICVSCHADSIHGGARILSLESKIEGLEQVVPTGLEDEIAGLNAQVADLEQVAEGRSWAGGTIGALVGLAVGAAVAWVWRRQTL
jgi:formate-dependent nitrite reductase cytochrome c552 subunit